MDEGQACWRLEGQQWFWWWEEQHLDTRDSLHGPFASSTHTPAANIHLHPPSHHTLSVGRRDRTLVFSGRARLWKHIPQWEGPRAECCRMFLETLRSAESAAESTRRTAGRRTQGQDAPLRTDAAAVPPPSIDSCSHPSAARISGSVAPNIHI